MARRRIGDLLFEAGLLTTEQLEAALEIQKRTRERLGDILIDRGFITEKQLIEVLEFQLGIPHVSLARQKLDPAILALVPEALASRYLVLPLRKERNKLIVAMADPLDYYAIDDLRMSTGFQIEPAIAAKDEIRLFIERVYSMKGSLEVAVQAAGAADQQEIAEPELVNDDSPVVRLVNQILAQSVKLRASDVHFDPAADGFRVRLRIDGTMRTEQTLPKHMQSVVSARLKIMANLNIAEHRLPQDGRFRFSPSGRDVDVRMATLPTVHGEKIVLRILDQSIGLQKIDQLGFTTDNLQLFRNMLAAQNGLLLITGPTGSGKTSTLYAGLGERSTPEVNVIAIEDPVEYQLAGVNQVPVNVGTGLTFAKGLRSILRQDPDVIMVGEIRDQETAEIATRAALTGHLVLSTLHTNDAVATIARLVDMGIEPFLVASSLIGVIAQRLVRTVCSECRHTYFPVPVEQELLAAHGVTGSHFTAGRGCSVCGGTGYRGRVAIHEILRMDDHVRQLILHGATENEIREHVAQSGFRTLMRDGLQKAGDGRTSLAEVIRVASRDS